VANVADDSQPPKDMANVAPLDMAGAGQTRLIVEAVKESVADLKLDVKEIKGYRFGDLFKYLSALAAAVVLLGGMMIAVYFKIEDKIHTLSTASTRIEQKLDDLILRIPPVQTPAPRK
jgi:hypothetical protein